VRPEPAPAALTLLVLLASLLPGAPLLPARQGLLPLPALLPPLALPMLLLLPLPPLSVLLELRLKKWLTDRPPGRGWGFANVESPGRSCVPKGFVQLRFAHGARREKSAQKPHPVVISLATFPAYTRFRRT
jgi:hypothetical protein